MYAFRTSRPYGRIVFAAAGVFTAEITRQVPMSNRMLALMMGFVAFLIPFIRPLDRGARAGRSAPEETRGRPLV